MEIKILYEDNDLLVVDKPAEVVVFPDLIDYLIEKYPELKNTGEAPRYGVVHRLDKDTSGILLVAKSTEALIFLQKEFINRRVEKKYIALAEGEIKEEFGEIKTLIARSKKDFRKQVVSSNGREAITEFRVLERFKNYTLLEVQIKTGRRHQIRCHLSYLKHPIAGDKMYSFKNSKIPEGLKRQFLHASYLKIKTPNGKTKEFQSNLPEELKKVLENLKEKS
jgi:23S rRNA pseudouridine1911/1915/1917 synthase